jgi:hypothetical protein
MRRATALLTLLLAGCAESIALGEPGPRLQVTRLLLTFDTGIRG